MVDKKLTADEKAVVKEEAAAQVVFEAEESELAARRAKADAANAARIKAAEQVDVLPAPAEPPADEAGRLRNAISLAITTLDGASSREAIEQALRILRSA